ncbi:class I SAM-dependent methyltransferase [Mycolicibacterium lacusdiani]|uniref:class I SAM-dependent methyltransferase n=1 Tax=Mycolicibacterium lacusdiani TaxID=2895283 RepID=UPI001F2EAB8F|nr:class I SAM-dependent methyltransferase [Mycolicibacterium lacusdiani]
MGDLLFRIGQSLVAPRIDRAIPRVALKQENIDRCQLLLNRRVLLDHLPAGGTCAEIGVDEGDFTEEILANCHPSELHLIDMWGTRRYSQKKFQGVTERFADQIADGSVVVHRRSSLEAASEFDDGVFDWVYIDTTHAYELTAAELRAYAPKVKPGGFIAGHDYVMGNWSKVLRYGVVEAVHEFCVECDWEIVFATADPIENQSFAIRRIQT